MRSDRQGGGAGFAGVFPSRVGLVAEGLEDALLQRWDRWFEMAAARHLPGHLDPRRSAWRLAVRGGIFGPAPVAGAMRLSRDAAGRVYPFAVLRPGPPPEAGDPWFGAAEAVVTWASGGTAPPRAVARAVAALPPPAGGGGSPEGVARLWRDEWEVAEVVCPDAAALAAFPLDLMAAAQIEEAEPWP
jgi:type VI secretion system protein ImpM